jgi:hypothetical protein
MHQSSMLTSSLPRVTVPCSAGIVYEGLFEDGQPTQLPTKLNLFWWVLELAAAPSQLLHVLFYPCLC